MEQSTCPNSRGLARGISKAAISHRDFLVGHMLEHVAHSQILTCWESVSWSYHLGWI